MSKVKMQNFMNVIGYVQSFKITTFKSGTKKANLAIKDRNTNNVVFVGLFDKKGGFDFNGHNVDLEGLKKILVDKEGNTRDVLVRATGRCSETKGTDANGNEKVYENYTAFKIVPYSDEEAQGAALTFAGIVENAKYGEDKNGEPIAKFRVGTYKTNKDGNITGVENMTLVAHGDVAEKLEDKGVEKFTSARFVCDMLNVLPKRNIHGDFLGEPIREVRIVKFTDFLDEDDCEDEVKTYKKAKKLEKGEFIEVSKDGDEELSKPKKSVDDEMIDDLDF